MTVGRQVFLFVVWAKARKFEDEIRETLAHDFRILLEAEMSWPRREFSRKLRKFYGFGSRFTWWNKARKCGRGPFKVFLVEDLHPEFKSETDTRGRHLLVDERVYRDKKSLRLKTHHSNLVHSSVTVEETDAQMKVLFGCGAEEFLSMLSCDLKFLAAGSRRACYEIPGTDLCLKCYRDEAQATGAVAREIRKFRHDEKRNTCCQEYRYYQELKRRLPDYVFAAFPERLEQVYLPSRGWCLVESQVRNADGSPCERFSRTYRSADKAMQAKLLKEFWLLIGAFAAYGVRFYDPQNILVQHLADGSFRLRVVDFEPVARTLLPIDSFCPRIVRAKVIRRAERYLTIHCNGLKSRYRGLPAALRRRWDALIATEGARMGLTDWRAFLENKSVNDIFYEGLFNGRPCVVKCSSRAPESIVNEYELAKRLHDADSVIVAKPLAVHEGPMAFVVVEKVCGPSLTGLRFGDPAALVLKADDIAADFLRMAEALGKTGIVHRDMGTTDNYLLGADGHLKLIDFQFAVDRACGCIDPWLRAHPKYHYAVFSCQLIGSRAYWNDLGYLAGHLRYRLPATERTRSVASLLVRDVEGADFSIKLGLFEKLVIFAYRSSLLLQRQFFRPGTHKARVLDFRLSRFAVRERRPVR